MPKKEENKVSNAPETKAKKSLGRRVFSFVWKTVAILLLIFLILLLLLRVTSVQNWVADKATDFISETLKTKVSLDFVDINRPDILNFHGLYIEDLNGDTLLYAEDFNTNLDYGYGWDLLVNRTVGIEELSISNAIFKLTRGKTDKLNNIQALLAQFSNEEQEQTIEEFQEPTEQKPFYLNVETIYLDEVRFVQENAHKGENLNARLRKGEILVDKLNLETLTFDVKSVNLEDPFFGVYIYDERTYDIDTTIQTNLPEILEDINEDFEQVLQDTAQVKTVWTINVATTNLKRGHFILENTLRAPTRTIPEDVLDYNHLDVRDIDIAINDFTFDDWDFSAEVEQLKLREKSGFICKELKVDDAFVSWEKVELNGFKLLTPQSEVGDTIILKYSTFEDFLDFNNEVRMDLRINDAQVLINDIIQFAPVLQENPFFFDNRNQIAKVDGRLRGKTNSLRGTDLDINLAGKTRLTGEFRSRNLTIADERFMDAKLERLTSNVQSIKQLIPNLQTPENFDKLGNIAFKGNFFGFFSSFVSDGYLSTELGDAEMDLQLNVQDGREKATYKGGLQLINFDLNRWSDNPDLGTITFTSKILDGRGLNINTANARLEAKIDSFFYRDYNYKNLNIEGVLNQNLFDGQFDISDRNIDFDFVGSVDFTNELPLLDFAVDFRRINFGNLNLSKQDYVLAGKVDLDIEDIVLSNMRGKAAINDLQIIKNRADTFSIDSIVLDSKIFGDQKILTLQSEVADGIVNGQFKIEEIPNAFTQFFFRNYPELSELIGLAPTVKVLSPSKFDYRLEVQDSKNLTDLFVQELAPLRDVVLEGKFDSFEDLVELEVEIPQFKYQNVDIYDLIISADAIRDTSDLDIGFYRALINDNIELAPVSLLGLVNRDTVDFSLTGYNFNNFLNDIEFGGRLYLAKDNYEIRFEESELVLYNDVWTIKEDNYIRFGKDYVDTENFVLTNDLRKATLTSINKKGLKLKLEQFNLDFINEFWTYEPLQFKGRFELDAQVENFFTMEGIDATAHAPVFDLNGDIFGKLDLKLKAKNTKSPLIATIDLEKGDQKINLSGYYNLPSMLAQGNVRSQQPNYFDFDAKLSKVPLNVMDYWLSESLIDTEGEVSATADIFGFPDKPEINGLATIDGGAFTIQYLNTRYFVDGQTAKITNSMIDASGALIKDKEGNVALLEGGITHNHLKDFGLNLQILSDRFWIMDTYKGYNDLFYGSAIGRGDIRFTGDFRRTDMYANATAGFGTKITIPVDYDNDASEVNFIKFKSKRKQKEGEDIQAQERTGLSIIMDIDLTPQAEMEITFDEQAGDILKGTGFGHLQMVIPRGEDFTMFGDYIVEEGSYLFTLADLVNKPFSVKKGGTIKWSGDPFGADLNLNASYTDVKATLTNFIPEYLATATAEQQSLARDAQEVDLTMKMTGQLLKPSINFDLSFPNLSGDLKNFSENKIRTLQSDQNEMNRQVFGLLVLGEFLPSDFNLGSETFTLGVNTVTQMLSQQLSNYITDLVSGWLTEDGFISRVDIDVAYRRYTGQEQNGEGFIGNEVEFKVKNYLFNDRVNVVVGGNYNDISDTQFAGELAIEYLLTPDGNLKIRFYQTSEPELGGRKAKTGLGLTYRKEFDNFSEFLGGLRKTVKKDAG